jgi:hypothetical protein
MRSLALRTLPADRPGHALLCAVIGGNQKDATGAERKAVQTLTVN